MAIPLYKSLKKWLHWANSSSQKNIYKSHPDPNPPIVFENPERILRKSSSKVGKDTYQLYKSISLLVEGVESIEEVIFDLKF